MSAKPIFHFIKSEAVLAASWLLAVCSMFFVPPDKGYFSYIDWRSLGILWSLMVIMNVFKQNGIFDLTAQKILSSVKRTWMITGTLIFLCFFLSMAITNDVALITFVPFAIMILNGSPLLIPTIVLQTVAANLGSMLTPVGNPQNLYLFALGNFTAGGFIKLIFPYWILSLVLLVFSIFLVTKRTKGLVKVPEKQISRQIPVFKTSVFAVLFIAAILTVTKIIPYPALIVSVLIFSLILQPKAFLKADYFLLLTFIGFFIFTGNMSRIPSISGILEKLVEGRELFLGIAASQVISNVPAALLLSGFTHDIPSLVLGTDIGGLGTLIASMASLISFKFYVKTPDSKAIRYILYFTAVNLIFLMLLIAEHFVLNGILKIAS